MTWASVNFDQKCPSEGDLLLWYSEYMSEPVIHYFTVIKKLYQYFYFTGVKKLYQYIHFYGSKEAVSVLLLYGSKEAVSVFLLLPE